MEDSPSYLSISGGYRLLNLIPSYELVYNNKLFLKLKFRNLENNASNMDGYFRIDAYNFVLNYNFLKKISLHSFKIGLGYVLINLNEKQTQYDAMLLEKKSYYYNEIEHQFLLSLSYSYKITPNFSFGIDVV